jgi:1-acyl-sn-glycerol-3-phosphate acyltransferase
MMFLRSLVFHLVAWFVVLPSFVLLTLWMFPLPARTRVRAVALGSRVVVWLAEVLVGIRYRVTGREHLPDRPAVILSNHQSAWETFAFQAIFPPVVFLTQRWMLWIPFFGWSLALTSPIAVDLGRRATALKSLAEQGRARLEQGFWIALFPEGTRVPVGEKSPQYQIGGAWLAVRSGATVVPVAHNAGLFWGNNAFLKRPGTVTVEIGPPIESAGADPYALMASVERWIESRKAALSPELLGLRGEIGQAEAGSR